MLAGCLVSGLMVGPVWAVSWEVSTRSAGSGAYDADVNDPEPTSEIPRPHLLEIPFVWFAVQLVEWAIVVALVWTVVPRTWPMPLLWAIWILVLGAVATVNYSIRRRFIPR